jgi:hypothetical protein
MSRLVCLLVQTPGAIAYSGTDRSMQSTVKVLPSTAMATGPAHSLMVMAAEDDKVVLCPIGGKSLEQPCPAVPSKLANLPQPQQAPVPHPKLNSTHLLSAIVTTTSTTRTRFGLMNACWGICH